MAGSRRWSSGMLDVAFCGLGLVLAALATWVVPSPVGTPVAGPVWLRLVFPLGLALPLLLRRTRALEALAVVLASVLLQTLVTWDSPEGLELIFCVGAAMYAAAAYNERGRAVVGLVLGAVTYVVYAAANADIRSGRAGDAWAGAFFGISLVTVWLAGVFVRHRRAEAAIAARTAAAELRAQEAVAEERARLARELHDVISHKLSVVVVQAAGARASGRHDPATLEKIERSGRDSLTEMRRMLGVLRQAGDAADLEPQPGLDGLDELVESFRDAGLPVDVTVTGDRAAVSAALQLSAYRIVEESLTNVLKHAGPAAGRVEVRIGHDSLTIEVVDDGRGGQASAPGGHGLVGMRERVALFGGRLETGNSPGGGYYVHATIPLPVSDP